MIRVPGVVVAAGRLREIPPVGIGWKKLIDFVSGTIVQKGAGMVFLLHIFTLLGEYVDSSSLFGFPNETFVRISDGSESCASCVVRLVFFFWPIL